MHEYELIDTTDNDCHDNGTKELMQAYAAELNEQERGDTSVKKNRWVAKPAGYSDRNFKG